MASAQSILQELRSKASEQTRKTFIRHGMPADRTLGVSIADLKLVAKTIKRRQDLAYELFDTGFVEAMYLAGLVADGAKMTRNQLQSWAEAAADMTMISEHTVPWVVVENPEALQLARNWIRSEQDHVASAGWCTLSGLVATKSDDILDLEELQELLRVIARDIHGAKNRTRYTMNEFVISIAIYVRSLADEAKNAARLIGNVSVDVGDTACKVPVAIQYIEKVETAGKVGVKRKTIRC